MVIVVMPVVIVAMIMMIMPVIMRTGRGIMAVIVRLDQETGLGERGSCP